MRKKWLTLTPEEWVRQHLLNYLINHKNYPASRLAIEKELILNDTKKRFDLVVYNENLQPFLIIECKAPYIELDNSVIDQVKRYNISIKAEMFMVSNGMMDIVFKSNGQRIELPDYSNPSEEKKVNQ